METVERDEYFCPGFQKALTETFFSFHKRQVDWISKPQLEATKDEVNCENDAQ